MSSFENPFPYALDPFQQQACEAISNHQHVLVTAKTGSGKTLVGEYQIKQSLKKGKRVLYTTPIKSLSNQKFHDLKEMGVNVGIVTGDIKFAPQSDVVVMTTEILTNCLTSGDSSVISLENVDAVIFDEVHYICDPQRGKVWEQAIALLPAHINMVMLSATIAGASSFCAWIKCIKGPVVHVSGHTRVVPLTHRVFSETAYLEIQDKRETFNSGMYQSWLSHLDVQHKKVRDHAEKVKQRRRDGFFTPSVKTSKPATFQHRLNECITRNITRLPAIFFVFSRAKCEEFAHKVSANLLDSSDSTAASHILNFHLQPYPDVRASTQYFVMLSLIEKGVAFHHSGVLPVLKEIVEILFSREYVKVLFATETFAVGINMPAKTVVFTSYEKHSDSGVRMLTPSEYIQMAGRAGRRGKDVEGFVEYLPEKDPSTLEEVRRMMMGGCATLQSQMDFGYDFFLKNTNWTDVVKKTYWVVQQQSQNDMMRHEIAVMDSPVPANADALRTRMELEETITYSQNSRKKQAQKALQEWKDVHPFTDEECAAFKKWDLVQQRIHTLQRQIVEVDDLLQSLYPRIEFLQKEGFMKEPLSTYSAAIHEGHSILMAVAWHNKLFHALPVDQLVGCLAIFIEDEYEKTLLSPYSLTALNLLHSQQRRLETNGPIQGDYWNTGTWCDPAILWVRGHDISEICGQTIYEGTFVRNILKLANIVDEWIQLATISCDLEQLELTRTLRQTLIRGVVVPDSLYLRT